MLTFEEKKAIFRSFNLEEKQTSNGRINFHYPESKQRGQVVGTQLHTNGNGYVIGKYMSPDTINRYGYKIDSRGWIPIKEFTKEQLTDVISEAIKSMSVVENHDEFLQEGLLAVQVEGDNNEEKRFENENIHSLNDERKSPCVSRWLWWTKIVVEFNRIIWGGSIERK
ncbi:hypothetical protein [Mesobacillus maritimus]|uniref:Uncharacterized protein n=1 Tax=Mesobacillus maritimus TaxID=1643336 RepID=A0ABS7K3B5_9BACI|nr:hypothetical protein [Mesobacillus maritimus]MBY0096674.1 hypothetical protein [Mesobacillus maritimus]